MCVGSGVLCVVICRLFLKDMLFKDGTGQGHRKT